MSFAKTEPGVSVQMVDRTMAKTEKERDEAVAERDSLRERIRKAHEDAKADGVRIVDLEAMLKVARAHSAQLTAEVERLRQAEQGTSGRWALTKEVNELRQDILFLLRKARPGPDEEED